MIRERLLNQKKTEGIARIMALDLRSFDIVEVMGLNELFIVVTNPFLNFNSFGNLDSLENPDSFENLEIFKYTSRSRRNFVFLTRPDISGSRRPLCNFYIFHKIKLRLYG